jgi:hypothetical protein
MTDFNALPQGKYTKICKLLDIVMAVVLVVFFICSLLPYCVRSAGETMTIGPVSIEIDEDDSWSLLQYCGFPEDHEMVEEFQKAGYKLDDPVFDTKTVSVKQVGMILALDIFGIILAVLLLLKKGLGRPLFCTIWGIVGLLGFNMNYLLRMGNTAVRPIMIALVVVVLVVGLVDTVLTGSDARAKTKYLQSISAAYK